MDKEHSRQNNFDFLRFSLAFIVVVGHLIILSKSPQLQFLHPFFNTYISVTGFFCISGFLITRSFLFSPSLNIYLKKRMARLLPAYVLVILLCVTFLSGISSYSYKEYFFNPQLYKYLLANFSFLNFIEPCLPGVFSSNTMCSINGALWTLKVEIAFYLSIPVLVYFVQKTKRKHVLFLVIYILAVVYRNGLNYFAVVSDNSLYAILSRQLPGFLSYFICGVALHFYYNAFIKYKNILFLTGVILFFADKIIHFEVFAPLGLSLMVFALAFSFKKLNNFGKYGDISYGIYIFHFPLIQLAVHFGLFERYNPFLVAFCILAAVIILGLLSWHLVEKKILNLPLTRKNQSGKPS